MSTEEQPKSSSEGHPRAIDDKPPILPTSVEIASTSSEGVSLILLRFTYVSSVKTDQAYVLGTYAIPPSIAKQMGEGLLKLAKDLSARQATKA